MEIKQYYFKKSIFLSSLLVIFFVTMLIFNVGFGYYWNALQGLMSGVPDITHIGTAGGGFGNVFSLLMVFLPVITFAILTTYYDYGENLSFRTILLIPMAFYVVSLVIEVRRLLPFSESFKDVYVSIDNGIYLPYILLFSLLAIYYLAVVLIPSSLSTKIIGMIVLVFSVLGYIVMALYTIYTQAMGALAGSFSINSFVMHLVCFSLDVASYFTILSVLMSFCAMKREIIEWEKEEMVKYYEKPKKSKGVDYKKFASNSSGSRGTGRSSLADALSKIGNKIKSAFIIAGASIAKLVSNTTSKTKGTDNVKKTSAKGLVAETINEFDDEFDEDDDGDDDEFEEDDAPENIDDEYDEDDDGDEDEFEDDYDDEDSDKVIIECINFENTDDAPDENDDAPENIDDEYDEDDDGDDDEFEDFDEDNKEVVAEAPQKKVSSKPSAKKSSSKKGSNKKKSNKKKK